MDRLVAPFVVALTFGVGENVIVYAFGAQTQDVTVFVLAVLALALLPRQFLEERYEARA
jgi:branched-chain amino acid transport system permease protein